MQIRDINKPVNSKTLNETMAKKYGTKINVDSFTLEQLQDARNKLRTKLSDIETNESFSGLSQNKTYSKNKLFLDVLNAAISERSDIDEGEVPAGLKAYQDKKKGKEPKADSKDSKGGKPDFLDLDKDGDKKEPMKKAAKDAKNEVKEGEEEKMPLKAEVMKCCKKGMTEKEICEKYKGCNQEKMKLMASSCMKEYKKMNESKHIDEGKEIINNYFKKLVEGEEDKAEIVMAAKDMVDRLTGWMEDTAEMQSESMLELADAIRDEMGAAQSESFTNTVKPALESLYTAMEGTRVALTQGVGMLTGEAEPMDAMGDEPALDAEEPGMEPTVDAEEPAMDDGMGASPPAAGGEDEAGRAKRESIQRSRRLGTILSSRN